MISISLSCLSSRSLNFLLAAVLSLLIVLRAPAQESPVLNQRSLKVITDSLASQLLKFYIEKEPAERMAAAVQKKYRSGAYKGITDAHVLAGRLTADLRAVHNDEHLHVEFNPVIAAEMSGDIEDVPALVAEKLELDRTRNFGFRKVEILDGNIGYLELSRFSRLNQYSRNTAHSALQLLSNASALVIDLRYGVGGSPEMMTYILGHFYRDRIHACDIYLRCENTTLSYHTTPDSMQGRLTYIPIYVLTSYKTFSAAEGLAYTLQQTGRAKIIGEVTRGGAHTVTYRPLSNGFVCDIPFGNAISPVTGRNWEKTGITPDLAVSETAALDSALHHYFRTALSSTKDSAHSRSLRWHLNLLTQRQTPSVPDSASLMKLTGRYGAYCISYDKGCLYYQKTGKARYPLIPVTGSTMRVKGTSEFVIEFVREGSGKASGIVTLFEDGRAEQAQRSE